MTFRPAQRLKNVKKSATRRLYDNAPPGSINLGLGEPDFQTPDVVRREACRVIQDELNGYTRNAGIPELRRLIAEYHSPDVPGGLSERSICVMSGVEEALYIILMSMIDPGDEVLLPDPSYIAYPVIAEMAGASVRYYPSPASRRFGLDREAFDRAVTGKTRLVLICSPSNPTGQILSKDDLQSMAARLDGTGAYVVADEIYRELYYQERPPSISAFYPHSIILSGLSKMMSMTGWRIGWAAGPEEVIAAATLLHQYVATCASSISQKASIAAFSDEGRAATAMMREDLGLRRAVMVAAIERELRLPCIPGAGAFYVMLDVSRFGPSEEVALTLLEHGVITVPGSAFGSQAEGYLRLSFSVNSADIEEGIRRIAAGLARIGPAD